MQKVVLATGNAGKVRELASLLEDFGLDVVAQTDLGVQALASHPMKTDKRGIGDLNVAVTFAGVTFRPGEYIYADNNGVIVSPSPLKMPE